MTLEDIKVSLTQSTPPETLSELVKALWYEAKGDWERAHNIAQDVHSPDGSWVHAYLHRKEGDIANASYWYQRAKRKMPTVSLSEEWDSIVSELLLQSIKKSK
jgi:hypothetical protein